MRLLLILFLVPVAALAQSKSQSDVWVRGHYRSNGTYVEGHYRSAPNGTRADNFSTRGNVNPYTGERGTQGYSVPRYSGSDDDFPWGAASVLGAIGLFILWGMAGSSGKRKGPPGEAPDRPPVSKVDPKHKPARSKAPSAKKRPPPAKLPPHGSGPKRATGPKCKKCGGRGRIERFSHISGGRCFACDGTGEATSVRTATATTPSRRTPDSDDSWKYDTFYDAFERDELCDPDLVETWDAEHRHRGGR